MIIYPKTVSDYEIGSNTHVPNILFDYTYVLDCSLACYSICNNFCYLYDKRNLLSIHCSVLLTFK